MADSEQQIRLAIVHWFPLEQYPPVTNALNCFARDTDWAITVWSTTNVRNLTPFENAGIRVRRTAFPFGERTKRAFRYLWFQISVLFQLFVARPTVVFYWEPHSAMPAFFYCLIARKTRLFIHYHEYRDRHEYLQPGMRLVRLNHWLEKRFLYNWAEWISQTNDDRKRMFVEDFPYVDQQKVNVLPNYPPKNWYGRPQSKWISGAQKPLRLVYVGAVSKRDTFIEPLVEWVEKPGVSENVTLDVYSHNYDNETERFLLQSESDGIHFHGHGVEYHEIPALLADFHVGLILYRAHTRNYQFNASNKLFEYLALGLDVWYPPQMQGVDPYRREDVSPRVWQTDFESLHELDLGSRQAAAKSHEPSVFSCEMALEPLITQCCEKTPKTDVAN